MSRVFSSIRAKLIGAFSAMLVVVLVLSGISFYGASQLAASTQRFSDSLLPSVEAAGRLRGDVYNARITLGNHIAATLPADMDQQEQTFKDRSALVSADLEAYAPLVSSAEEKADLDDVQKNWSSLVNGSAKLFEMSRTGSKADAYAYNQATLKPFSTAAADAADKIVKLNSNEAVEAATAADQSEALVKSLILGMAVVGLLLTIGFAILITLTIMKGINRLVVPMGNLAKGDLETEIPMRGETTELGRIADAVEIFKQSMIQTSKLEADKVVGQQRVEAGAKMMAQLQSEIGDVIDAGLHGDFSRRVATSFTDVELQKLASGVNELVATVDKGLGETSTVLAAIAKAELMTRVTGEYAGAFGKLKADTNAVADRLTDIVTQLQTTSRGLKSATGEILAGANDLADRTTKQAAAIEETSAAVEQITTTVNENAKRAAQAAEKARSASALANEGGEVMGEANDAMGRITASSGKISNIIGLIDDIAFQTNLLALNASVEAARAGDAGKGFAVVAVEVRRLAQSAASASADVKSLIEQSNAEVVNGSRLVSSAAQKLTDILSAVEENSSAMNDIAVASHQQSSSIKEVASAVRQMDEMTQHNAALVEETNAAIEQTEAQAQELDRLVDVFKLERAVSREVAGSTLVSRAKGGIKSLQQHVAKAAKTYLSSGNTALAAQSDWSEF